MRAVVLTPQMTGADGVSEMSRQVVGALEAQVGVTLTSLDVWSLHDTHAPACLDAPTRFRPARGSKVAFASFAARLATPGDAIVVVLHLHLLPVVLPLMYAGLRVVPVLLGIESWTPLTRLQCASLRRAWRVAAISQHTIDRFRAANPRLASIPVRVCHPGLTAQCVTTESGSNEPNVLIVGRMASSERYKGHDELLDIWPQVRARVPGATLIVAGGGDDRARLVSKAEALGVSECVRFQGVVPAERLAELYRDAALFVMPSPNEGFGLVFVEAMRAGTPCIGATGAAEEIVDHGVTGLIVRAGDRDQLARGVIDLLTDPAARLEMGRRAAEVANHRFSPAAFAGRLYELLGLDPRVSLVTATQTAC